METIKHLAIDIGASSGRHILGSIVNGKLVQEEVYRFENGADKVNGNLVWDIERLFNHIINGLKACASQNKQPSSVAIDLWGVDYVLLDKADLPILPAFCYRDLRTLNYVDTAVSFEKMYAKTGISFNSFNTVYQLLADNAQGRLEKASDMLMLAEYFSFLLTGKKAREYTVATTTGLVNATSREWDYELIKELGIPTNLFSKLNQPGHILGGFTQEIIQTVGFDAQVILPAMHDTASAVVAVPVEDALYISSGTWSLLGVESAPILTDSARLSNYSNEGALNNKVRFQKNIMGLWMIQQVRKELGSIGQNYTFAELANLAEQANFDSVVDVDNNVFFSPQSMIEAIKNQCAKSGQPVPQTAGELAQCVYLSLAIGYKKAVYALEQITSTKFKSIHIIGGGSKNTYLNRLTAKHTGLKVFSGPDEATSTGNLLVQIAAFDKSFNNQKSKELINNSFEIKEI